MERQGRNTPSERVRYGWVTLIEGRIPCPGEGYMLRTDRAFVGDGANESRPGSSIPILRAAILPANFSHKQIRSKCGNTNGSTETPSCLSHAGALYTRQ